MTIALLVVGAVVGGLLAVVTAFYVPTRPVALGVVAVVVLLGPYAHLLGRALRSPAAGALPSVVWLVVTMTLASTRAEGDLVVTGSASGLAYLLLGTVSAAVGMGTVRSAIVRSDRKRDERAAALAAAAPAEEGVPEHGH